MKKKYLFALYIIGLIIILGIKYLYSKASSAELDFILAPTARWVTLISGIDFTKQADVGYINHGIRFIIAPGCSGMQFMLITFAALFFPFVHRMKSVRGGVCWLVGSFVFSYPFTVFVNGLRIMMAIYIPVYFDESNIYADWLTPERLHTIIGTVVYVVSLLAVYPLAGLVSKSKDNTSPEMLGKFVINKFQGTLFIKMLYRFVPPMLCYFSIALVIPLLHNARQNNFKKFFEYATLITSVCFAVIIVSCIAYAVWEHLRQKYH
jgi:exosortase K